MRLRFPHLVATLFLHAVLSTGFAAPAELVPGVPFRDGAVLQHGMPLPVFGRAAPGIVVRVALREDTAEATTDAGGRWIVWLPAQQPSGKPCAITISASGESLVVADVLIGEVWLAAGQSNMARTSERVPTAEALLQAEPDELIRVLQIQAGARKDPRDDAEGRWSQARLANAREISAVAYHFARELRRELGMPIGVIVSAWGGARVAPFTPLRSLEQDPALRVWLTEFERARLERSKFLPEYEKALAAWRKLPARTRGSAPLAPLGDDHKGAPANIYNAMIHPLVPSALRGVIWYQGESDALEGFSDRYARTFRAMVEGWREAWQIPDLPFFSVQLPGFLREDPRLRWASGNRPTLPASDPNIEITPVGFARETFPFSAWPRLRLEQAAASSIPHTGMVIMIDQSDPFDLHPQNKHIVGARLAGLALRDVYDRQSHGHYPRPTGQAWRDDAGRIHIPIQHGRGLICVTPPTAPFATAPADGPFAPASMMIQNDELVLIPLHEEPATRIRYAWGAAPLSSIVNEDGRPLGPFEIEVTQKPHP